MEADHTTASPTPASSSPKRLKLLIANDDGIDAHGLISLARALEKCGLYDIRIVAPSKQQSGVSHSITLRGPVWAEEYTMPEGLSHLPAFSVDGTPADCVKVALTAFWRDWKPDVLVSGINWGLNVGHSVLYSGTVGACLEGVLNKVPACLALSLDFGPFGFTLPIESLPWDDVAEMAVPLINKIVATGIPIWHAVNLNFPKLKKEEVKGVKVTWQGHSGFDEFFSEKAAEDGSKKRQFVIKGRLVNADPGIEYDYAAVQAGYISVSPMGVSFLSDQIQTVKQKFAFLDTENKDSATEKPQ